MDYIFYRIYLYYKKKDDLPILSAILFLQVLKVSILFFTGTFINILTHGLISTQNGSFKKETYWVFVAIVLTALFIFDFIRYSRRNFIQTIETRYLHNKKNKKVKLWQIIVLPILFFLLSFTIISFTR